MAAGFGGPAAAQGIDCTRARTATEKAICASPPLMALDRQSAAAYADALARQPEARDAMRQDLVRWLRERDAACALPAAQVPQCLRAQITRRIASLAPPSTASAAPAAPAPAPGTVPQPPPGGGPGAATITDAALPPLADPTVPPDSANPPAPAATLDNATVPAAEQAETLLHVTSPGRFAIAAKSPSGAALQLVDMLAGPGEVSGVAGTQDGRVDALLDVGTYKVRVMSAKGAAGPVALAVTAFRDAAPPRALPRAGQVAEAALRDGEQRAFWFAVPPGGVADTVRIEAAGRSLADLRLWRDGRDLVAMDPATTAIEPKPGHGMTDLRLQGKLEPGTYLAVAYGGPATAWTDNDASQPFLLRAGASAALDAGWAGGTMGPFGSEVYALAPHVGLVRLRLPAPAPADLVAGDTASILRNSREPVATLFVTPGRQPVVEVRAAAGQAFTVRALERPTTNAFSRAGTYYVSALAIGAGGDEVPATALLLNRGQGSRPARIAAEALPHVGPGAAWRARFNLRGPTSLVVSNQGGPTGLRTSGTPVQSEQTGSEDLPAGFYVLRLRPEDGAQGAVEMVLGPPGVVPPPPSPMPPDPAVPLGVQTVAPGERLVLGGTVAPDVVVGLSVRPSPVALVEGPVGVSMTAGSGAAIAVRLAPGGALRVTEVGVGPVPYSRQDGTDGRVTVTLPAADHPRTVLLAWQRAPAPPAPIPPPQPQGAEARVVAGTPAFFDLRRDESRSFGLQVPEGGLLRVETLGRLHTEGRLATPFLPGLGEADANGIGENMLLQRVLRAGRYRVTVTAKDSAGHLGLAAAPAPLLDGGTLRVGGTVRASLPAGTGAAFPVAVDEAGTVHLDVLGQGDPWQGRLEDPDGWPVTAPGKLDGIERKLAAGRYRLLVEPAAVARLVVARLRPVLPAPAPVEGHGPHPLPFEARRQATWREPEGQGAPRTPDAWTFALAGPADATVALTDTMVGVLKKDGEDGGTRVVKTWSGHLDAGSYRLEVTALGRNDRATYSVKLSTKELQPGVPRSVTLPATLPFAVADGRVAGLTSFGSTPVKAVLRRADGTVVGRYRGRTDDWNVAVSRPLAAGAYTLDLSAAGVPDTAPVDARDPVPSAGAGGGGTDNSGGDSGNADSGNGDAGSGDGASTDNGNADNAAPDNGAMPADVAASDDQGAQTAASQQARRRPRPAAAAASDGSDGGDAPAAIVEVTLSLPATVPAVAVPDRVASLAGSGVHVLTLPAPGAGSLLMVAARSAAPLVLALERKDGAGWMTVGLDQGLAPAVAAPGDGDARAWRAEVWAVDGGPDPVDAAARVVTADAQAPGHVALAAVDGMPGSSGVARISLLAAGMLALNGPPGVTLPDGMLAGGWPGHALRPLSNGVAVPQGREVWVLGPAGTGMEAAPVQFRPGEALAVTLPAGLTATLPAAADGIRVWRADSGAGLPSLGGAMGVLHGSAVALAGAGRDVPLRAADGEELRVTLREMAPALQPAQAVAGSLHAVVPPGAALPVTLPAGMKSLDLGLPPGVMAVPGWQDGAATAAWSGGEALARTMTGDWTGLLLVNLGPAAAPVSLSVVPAPAAPVLKPGVVFKRFFGAAGSFELAAEGAPGARVRVAGPATLTVIAADGAASSGVGGGGGAVLAGPGRVVVTHAAGAVAVWAEADGVSPWPEVAATAAALPSRVTLAGPAMRLAVKADGPVLLRATTTAPVLLGLRQAGRADAPVLFAAGADLHRILPSGSGEVSVYSAADGPLSGTLDLRAEPLVTVGEGLGPAVTVAPGGAAAFGFTLDRKATIGVGVRAEPDGGVSARLLDGTGKVVAEGIAELVTLPAGRYVLEATVPPDAAPAAVRPAVVGLVPRPSGPPPDVVRDYLELAGMKPQGKAQ